MGRLNNEKTCFNKQQDINESANGLSKSVRAFPYHLV